MHQPGWGSRPPVSPHLEARSRQRGQPAEVIGLVLDHGRETRAHGASFFVIHERDLRPELRRSPLAERANGVVVVVVDDQVMTVYRRSDATRYVRSLKTQRRRRRSG